jgi:redox-sensitive bicupin YhaK (pirin superfamily)
MTTKLAHLGKISRDMLFVSQPNPSMFGNPPNPSTAAQEAAGWATESKNWLKSRFHFSFAEYNKSTNQQFGCLRVMNDDLVQPNLGFGTHGHAEMEIATYVVEGALTHKDSMGTAESLGRGSVQFMTAGTGVRHSEFNNGSTPLRFIQMWVVPQRRGLTPNYGSVCGDASAKDRKDNFAHLVAPVNSDGGAGYLQLNQDVNMYAAEVSAGNEVKLPMPLAPGRQAYVLLVEGSGEVRLGADRRERLVRHDAAELVGGAEPEYMVFTADAEGAHWLVVEMKEDGRGGRTTPR